MMIEFTCVRCGTPLKVPESKAGKHGRCPICGGRITIPGREIHATPPATPQKPFSSKLICVLLVGIILLVGLCLVIALRRRGTLGMTEEGNGPAMTPVQQARRDAQLMEISKLEDMVRRFRESRVQERHLRAREVLMKINSYEPVSDFEYALRREVLEEEEKAAQSAGNAGGEDDPWQLNTPLEPSEKEELGLLSDDLQAQSARLERELNSVGIFIASARDPLGRLLLDEAEVSADLVARKDSIMKDAGKTAP